MLQIVVGAREPGDLISIKQIPPVTLGNLDKVRRRRRRRQRPTVRFAWSMSRRRWRYASRRSSTGCGPIGPRRCAARRTQWYHCSTGGPERGGGLQSALQEAGETQQFCEDVPERRTPTGQRPRQQRLDRDQTVPQLQSSGPERRVAIVGERAADRQAVAAHRVPRLAGVRQGRRPGGRCGPGERWRRCPRWGLGHPHRVRDGRRSPGGAGSASRRRSIGRTPRIRFLSSFFGVAIRLKDR